MCTPPGGPAEQEPQLCASDQSSCQPGWAPWKSPWRGQHYRLPCVAPHPVSTMEQNLFPLPALRFCPAVAVPPCPQNFLWVRHPAVPTEQMRKARARDVQCPAQATQPGRLTQSPHYAHFALPVDSLTASASCCLLSKKGPASRSFSIPYTYGKVDEPTSKAWTVKAS